MNARTCFGGWLSGAALIAAALCVFTGYGCC
jgi:hypothetical protein